MCEGGLLGRRWCGSGGGGRERRNKWGPTQSCRERHSGRTLTTDASLARLASPRSFSLLPLPPFNSLSSPPPRLSRHLHPAATQSRAARDGDHQPHPVGRSGYVCTPCSACQTRNPRRSPSCARPSPYHPFFPNSSPFLPTVVSRCLFPFLSFSELGFLIFFFFFFDPASVTYIYIHLYIYVYIDIFRFSSRYFFFHFISITSHLCDYEAKEP